VVGSQVEITATQTRSYDDRFNIFFFTTPPLPVLASEISWAEIAGRPRDVKQR